MKDTTEIQIVHVSGYMTSEPQSSMFNVGDCYDLADQDKRTHVMYRLQGAVVMSQHVACFWNMYFAPTADWILHTKRAFKHEILKKKEASL